MGLAGKVFKDWMTEADGQSFCPWNFVGIVSTMAMTYVFVTKGGAFADFGGAVALIIGSIAGKRWTEHSEGRPQ